MVKDSAQQLEELHAYFNSRQVKEVELSDEEIVTLREWHEPIRHDGTIINKCVATALSTEVDENRLALTKHANKGLSEIISKRWLPFVCSYVGSANGDILHITHDFEIDDLTTMKLEAHLIPFNCGILNVVSARIVLKEHNLLIIYLPMLVFAAKSEEDETLVDQMRQRLNKVYETVGKNDINAALKAFEKAMSTSQYS